MDHHLFLQRLRELPLEEGRAYIREHLAELTDHQAIGELMAEEALRILYTPFPSLKIAELLIFYGEITGHLSSHALGLKGKGNALQQIDHHQAAMEALDAAGEEFLRLGDEGNWARSRISWILAAAWLGRTEESLQIGANAREVFLRLGELYWACVIDSNIALILLHIGQYENAVKLYENILLIYPTVTNQSEIFIQRSIAIAQLNQAIPLFLLGEFEQAYQLQQKVLASLDALGAIDLARLVERNLIEFDYAQGYYGSALRRYYQARERFIQSDEEDPLLLADLKVCIANCLVKLDRMQEACLVSEEAIEAYRKVGMPLSIGDALHKHALTLAASGRLNAALSILNEAWELFRAGSFEPFAYLAKLQQAEILLEMGTTTDAYELASSVKRYADSQRLVPFAVRSRLVIIGVLIIQARKALDEQHESVDSLLEEARRYCNKTMSQARQHNLQEAAYKSHHLMGKIFTLQKNQTKTARHYQIAIAQIERMLGNLVHELSPSFLHTTWTIYEDMILLCLELGQNEKAFSYLERVRSLTLHQHLNKSRALLGSGVKQEGHTTLDLLRTQADLKDYQEQYRRYSTLLTEIDTSPSPVLDRTIIEQELQRTETKVNELFLRLQLHQVDVDSNTYQPRSRKHAKTKERVVNVQGIDPEHLRQHLSSEQLMLTYYLQGDKLTIFAMNPDGMFTYELAEGGRKVIDLLALFHAHLQPGGWPDPYHPPQPNIRRLLNKLYTLLIAPIEHLLPPRSGYLTIVPYGPLHKFPFHALYDGSRFLIEEYQVSYLPASGLLMHLGSAKGEQRDRSTRRVGAIKPPLIMGYSGNGQLQRVWDEAETVAALLGGHCLLEQQATIANLVEHAPATPIIHLSTHGQNRLDAPNFSYVRLADGQLNAIDAFNLNLAGCELVTLSGCETGLAVTGGADEQLGLGRAFLAAGASSLVMSLWSVEDNATCELMKRFYQHLLVGASKVQALRAAQCDFARQTESMYAHPYFWAAFRLVGDIGPIHYSGHLHAGSSSGHEQPAL